jgi:hypothetical protein
MGYSIETISNQKTGYAISAVTSEPCISKIGIDQHKFGQLQNIYLQTGGGMDALKLAESVTTTIDAKDIETEGKYNSSKRQLLQNDKK